MSANNANLVLKRDDEKMNDCAPPYGSNLSNCSVTGSNRTGEEPSHVQQIASTKVNTALTATRGASCEDENLAPLTAGERG